MKLNEITSPALTPAQVKWLKDMKITKYSVDAEGFVNVDKNVDISSKHLKVIPVKFGYVGGDFYCYHNNLSSLQGAPREVGGNFNCQHNNISSLRGGPREVGGNFYCSFNNLTSLQGGPKEVGGIFWCNNNNLSSLEGAPGEVGGGFYCWGNKLTSLQGAPREVGGGFYCSDNKFKRKPDRSFIKIGGDFVWEE